MNENVRVGLCVTHASFDPKRRESMDRLRRELHLGDALDGAASIPIFGRIPYREETERAPHHVWSKNQWAWGAEQDVDWVVFLQDDVLVAPDFWMRIESVLRDVMNYERGSLLSLLTNHIGSRMAFVEGYAGYWTRDGLMGNGYAATPATLRRLLEWRELEIVPGTAERVSEDVLMNLFVLAEGQRVYTPLPGLIDHDLGVGTLHAHEHGANRRAYVRWDDEDRRVPPKDPGEHARLAVDLGRFYETAASMLPGAMLDTSKALEIAREAELDRCPPEYARYFEMIVAQASWPDGGES